MDLWAGYQSQFNNANYGISILPPFSNSDDLYNTINIIEEGDIPWRAFSIQYQGPMPENPPHWMTEKYEVWYQDLLQVLE